MVFRLADSVSLRMVQIFQEAMLTMTDGADLLRQVRLEQDESDPNVLVMTTEYIRLVKETHEKLLQKADQLKVSRDACCGLPCQKGKPS